jgi:uncharacterized membrane protein
MERSATSAADRRELDRVSAFSDGVFAIAITLLVLNLEVPDVPGNALDDALSDLSDDFLAYAIGFAVMGLFWFGHHKLFARLRRASGRLVLVNLVFLAFIALMPFTTAVLGRYDEPLAIALYAANVAAALILDGLTQAVAVADGLYDEGVHRPLRAGEAFAAILPSAAVFLVSIPIAYALTPDAGQWTWLLLVPVAVFAGRRRHGAR